MVEVEGVEVERVEVEGFEVEGELEAVEGSEGRGWWNVVVEVGEA